MLVHVDEDEEGLGEEKQLQHQLQHPQKLQLQSQRGNASRREHPSRLHNLCANLSALFCCCFISVGETGRPTKQTPTRNSARFRPSSFRPAMYATKRKLHNLLTSLTPNASTTSLSSAHYDEKNASSITLPAELEPHSAKKRRLTRPISAGLASLSHTRTSHVTQSSIGSRKDVERPIQRLATTKSPNFAPYDRTQFLARLKTFRHVDKWSAKPTRVNEVQWAKRGWSCVGRERVGCVGGCGKEVYIKLEVDRDADEADDETEEWTAEADNQLVDHYADMIITEHDENCLWKKRGCDDGIYRLTLNHPPAALAALKSRYDALVAMSSELPNNITLPEHLSLSIISRQLPPDFTRPLPTPSAKPTSSASPTAASPSPIPLPPLNTDALALALFGWEAESGHITGLATCNACFRRLGLWLFKSKPSSPTSKASGTSSELDSASVTRLDVVDEHRDYCPWVNAESQAGGTNSSAARTSFAPTTKDANAKPRTSFTTAAAPSSSPPLPGWQLLLRSLRTAEHWRGSTEHHTSKHSHKNSYNTQFSEAIEEEGYAGDTRSDAHEADSGDVTIVDGPDAESIKDAKNEARWASLKNLRRAFDVKRGRKGRRKEKEDGEAAKG